MSDAEFAQAVERSRGLLDAQARIAELERERDLLKREASHAQHLSDKWRELAVELEAERDAAIRQRDTLKHLAVEPVYCEAE